MLEKLENRSIITNTVIEKEQKPTVKQRGFCSFLLSFKGENKYEHITNGVNPCIRCSYKLGMVTRTGLEPMLPP